MSVTVVREGNVLRIVDSECELPAGEKVKLFTAEELARRSGYSSLESAQLESLGREQKEDWSELLDPLTLPPGQMPSVAAARRESAIL
jgi:hypothetical protein